MKHYSTSEKTIRMRLNQLHTHAGAQLAAGAEIEVDAATADWLAARRIATHVPANPARVDQRGGQPGDDDHEH